MVFPERSAASGRRQNQRPTLTQPVLLHHRSPSRPTVALGTRTSDVVQKIGLPLGASPDGIARNHGPKDSLAEMLSDLGRHLAGQIHAPVEHRK
jgi:hypothetical protein